MRFGRCWLYVLVGGAGFSLATLKNAFWSLPELIDGGANRAELGEVLGVTFLLGGMCGFLVWAGRGLSRRFGTVADGLVGLVVVPFFFASCFLLIAPEKIDEAVLRALWPHGLPVLAVLMALGFFIGMWYGHNFRKELAEQEARPEADVEDPDLPSVN
jgi:hypothetical protein